MVAQWRRVTEHVRMTSGRDGDNTSGSNGNGKARDRDRLLTQKQAAALFQVSESAISKWVRQKKLKAILFPGGLHRVRESEVAKWLGEPLG